MSIETICLQEAFALAKRDRKYWLMLAHMYGKSIFDPKGAKALRASYFFCRHIDDVLDGDRKISGNTREYVEEIRRGMENPNEESLRITQLYHFAIAQIEKIKKEEDNPEADFKRVVSAMVFDWERSQQAQLLSREQLEQYYENTFAPVLNISLMIAKSQLRAEDIPEFMYGMGHLYSIRDMGKDIPEGIINIPNEELECSGLDQRRILSYERIRNNLALHLWMDDEVRVYGEEIRRWKKEVWEELDKGAQRVCKPIVRSLESFSEKYLNEMNESTYK